MKNTIKKITFDDVIGYEKEKEELREVQNYIINVEKYEEIGARIPKGILLIGESGNGKTLMAKALSSEINIPFYSIDDIDDEDGSIRSIRKVFAEARKNAPCVIFIDEIDKIGEGQSMFFEPTTGDAPSPILRELLTQMDGFQTNSGILVIATANSSDGLSRSLLRSGRFDRTIDIRMPNIDERRQLFEYYSRNKRLEEGIDFNKLAIRASGLCCADIDNVLNDAALITIREGKDKINMESIELAIDRVMFGANERSLSDELKKTIAVHEVGHAVVAIATGQKEHLNKISIVSRGHTMGFNRFGETPDADCQFTTKNRMMGTIMVTYGGIAAELVRLKDMSSGCAQDIDMGRALANMMARRYGMLGITNCVDSRFMRFDDGFSQRKKRRVEKLMDDTLDKALKNAIKIVKENNVLFDKLYDKLMDRNVIYKEEIEEIIAQVA